MNNINEFLKHKNYYGNGLLINNPLPLEDQLEPYVTYLYEKDIRNIEYSIVIPIYNQKDIIITNINSIINNIVGLYEVILIFDNCEDNSMNLVINYFKEIKKENLTRIICIEQKTPIFETSCDNIGFRLSKGKYIVEIQADIKIITYGFNYLLSKPFRLYNDVFAVSGRCTHTLYSNNGSISYGNGFGKLGNLVEIPLNLKFNEMNKFFISDTCNRGPLIFLNERIKELGYLDEYNFVLGDDDHDIMMRAKYQKNWICGYVPIEFYSPLEYGSTRKEMNKINKEFLNKRLKRRNIPFLHKVNNIPSNLVIRNLE